MRKTSLLILTSATLLIGCKSPSTTRIERREQTTSIQSDANTLDGYVNAVQSARTPTEEADALRTLHKWMADHGFTYQVQSVRVADNVPIRQASASGQPVTTTVTVYRGREVAKTFSFVPKDNRNLTLLGE